jgi:hypothetical protein
MKIAQECKIKLYVTSAPLQTLYITENSQLQATVFYGVCLIPSTKAAVAAYGAPSLRFVWVPWLKEEAITLVRLRFETVKLVYKYVILVH